MTSPFKYKDVAELMGSWPLSFAPGTTNFQIQPNSLSTKATMVGTVQETTDGYLVGGLSLTAWVDVAATPTAHTVSFPAGTGSGLTTDHFTLDEVIARFVASVPPLPANTAQKSNNFLLLQSQTSGQDSYLRLESIASAEAVFQALGLLPGVVIRGGELKHAQHIDPSRQVAGVGQLAMQHGENFSADVVNRLALQLGINTGAVRGVVDLRRIAVRKTEDFVGSGATSLQINTGSPAEGVYTGGVASPTYDQLLDAIVVLDEYGNEFVQEQPYTLTGPASDLNFSIEADTGKQLLDSATLAFTAADVATNRHVIVTDFAVATVLNDVPLKIIEYKSATQVVVMPVDPADGSVVAITETSRSGSRVEIYNVRCEVEGFYGEVGLTTQLEQQQIPVSGASGTVSAIETPNRIRCDAASFSLVKVGDIITWTGAVPVSPYSNNGTYRVSKVIDAKRIELVGLEFESIYLNLDSSAALGSVVVSSDGDFFAQPYIQFALPTLSNFTAGRGAIPKTGDNFQLRYLVSKTIKQALADSPLAFTGPARSDNEDAADAQRAIMRLAGPSVTTFKEILHGNYDLSLEKIDFRLDHEHYEENGRHSDIRPDTIDMFPGVAGITHTIRKAAADSDTQIKFRFLTDAGALKSSLASEGFSSWATDTPSTASLALVGSGNAGYHFQSTVGSEKYRWHMATTGAGDSILKLSIVNDGSGGALPNAFTFDKAGRVGIGLGQLSADTGYAGEPQATLHVRGRSLSDSELIRLEGFSNSDPTVAISFKPKKNSPFFGFVELDHDNPGGVGDWQMNFVLTADAATDSDGTISDAYFRWVWGAGGSPEELQRLRRTGLYLVDTSLLSASTGTHARRLKWSVDALGNQDIATIDVTKTAAGFASSRMRLYTGSTTHQGLFIADDNGVVINDSGSYGESFFCAAKAASNISGIFKSTQTTSVLRFRNATVSNNTSVGVGADGDKFVIRCVSDDRYRFSDTGISVGHNNTPEAGFDFGKDYFRGANFFNADTYTYIASHPAPVQDMSAWRRAITFRGKNLVDATVGGHARIQLFFNRYDSGDATTGDTWDGLDLPGIAITSNALQSVSSAVDTWDRDDVSKPAMAFMLTTSENLKDSPGGNQLPSFRFMFGAAGANPIFWFDRVSINKSAVRDLEMLFDGHSNPPIDTALFGNGVWASVLPINTTKCWAVIRSTGAGTTTMDGAGFSTSLTLGSNNVGVGFSTSMPSGDYCLVSGGGVQSGPSASGYIPTVYNRTASGFNIMLITDSGTAYNWTGGVGGPHVAFAVYGRT